MGGASLTTSTGAMGLYYFASMDRHDHDDITNEGGQQPSLSNFKSFLTFVNHRENRSLALMHRPYWHYLSGLLLLIYYFLVQYTPPLLRKPTLQRLLPNEPIRDLLLPLHQHSRHWYLLNHAHDVPLPGHHQVLELCRPHPKCLRRML